jgi:hypothetical protein
MLTLTAGQLAHHRRLCEQYAIDSNIEYAARLRKWAKTIATEKAVNRMRAQCGRDPQPITPRPKPRTQPQCL